MKNYIKILIAFVIIYSCKTSSKENVNYSSDILRIEQIGPKTFQHTSYLSTESYGLVPSNGLIYINGDEVLIFDTPVNDRAASELIDWLGSKKIKGVVVTHFHVDCLGGLNAFHSNNIESYATNQTIKLASEQNEEVQPKNGFDEEYKFIIGKEIVFARYFGQGHTEDNIVGYIPSEKLLFGGCLIKSLNAPKGNLEHANTAEWSNTVEKLKRELSAIEIVIPGHGKKGGTELLDYTIKIFKEH